MFLIDGGFSTQLAKYVSEAEIVKSPLWTAQFLHSNPAAVVKTHADFVEAGCDVLLTNTYQASVEGFQKHLGLNQHDSLALISKSVQLAREAIDNANKDDRAVILAGSVGAYGACLHDGSEYRGDYAATIGADKLVAWHRPRIAALVEAGVELLAIETIPSAVEALSLVKMLQREFPDQKFWLSFSIKDENCISDGSKFSEVADACHKLSGDQMKAVGVNCLHPNLVSRLLKTIQHLRGPFVVYPNRGEKWIPEEGWSEEESCMSLAQYCPEWMSLGARYIGGCCRVTADDIKLLRQCIDKLARRRHC